MAMKRGTKPAEARRRSGLSGSRVEHICALGRLMERAAMDAARLFDYGLGLLIQQLNVERAFMVLVTPLGYEATWWALAKDLDPGPLIRNPEQGFCPRVADHPLRPLVIRDARVDPVWKKHPAHAEFGVRSYMGVALWEGKRVMGVLSVQDSRPRLFTRPEISLVIAVSNLFSKTLEVELLRNELRQTRDALDLTAAVVQDSALESPETGLPSLHYLDIWMRANLYLARRRGEIMAVVRFDLGDVPALRKALQAVAERLRGEDLLVDLGRARFLLLLPRTEAAGTEILMDRIRERLGPVPMGATIWNPGLDLDQEDLEIQDALKRAERALAASRGLGGSPLQWETPEPAADPSSAGA